MNTIFKQTWRFMWRVCTVRWRPPFIKSTTHNSKGMFFFFFNHVCSSVFASYPAPLSCSVLAGLKPSPRRVWSDRRAEISYYLPITISKSKFGWGRCCCGCRDGWLGGTFTVVGGRHQIHFLLKNTVEYQHYNVSVSRTLHMFYSRTVDVDVWKHGRWKLLLCCHVHNTMEQVSFPCRDTS